MKRYLTESEYLCWPKYVQAISLFCSRMITHNNVTIANKLIHEFCLQFEELYGSEKCTPNLHLHCHMSESIINFGPASTFWLFTFERINGIFGKFHTNHHSIETQLMRKFITSQQIVQLRFPTHKVSQESQSLLNHAHKVGGSTKQTQLSLPHKFNCKVLPPLRQKVFSSADCHIFLNYLLNLC